MLSEFDIQHVTNKSVKGSVVADHLADNPMETTQSFEFEFPDEHLLTITEEEDRGEEWQMFFDGAVNVHGNGIGAVIVSPEGKQFPIAIKLMFEATNNMAEYEACATGLKAALNMGLRRLKVFGDSALIIYQVKGEWQTKDPKLVPYQQCLVELIKQFEEISFNHVSRDQNPFADALATLAAMVRLDYAMEVQPLQIRMQENPAHCLNTEMGEEYSPWFTDIKRYVQTREYPEGIEEMDKKTLRRLAMTFFSSGDTLYKRSHDGTLLRCVDEEEAQDIMKEVHEGMCSTHANGYVLSKQILRLGYYWTTLERDCISYVRKCHKCQVYADRIHAPPTQLNALASPWPFAMWGIDIIGAIKPQASNGHRFILVAIDYFTKWIEAASYAKITQKVFLRFLKVNIMCRYGLPERIITDNGTNLNGKEIQRFCDDFKIKHHNSSPYRPQMNGAVEAANKNIKKIIQRMVVTFKDWHEMLPYALHAYRTTVRSSTGATPYSLVYGMEAVMPIEVEIPSLRTLLDVDLEEAEWVKARYDQLNLIEEKRLSAICHGQLYQARMTKAFNKRVKPRVLFPGDLVLKKILPTQEDPRGKWAPNYEGPYVVKHAFSGGALILTDLEGQELPRPVNIDSVKKYYI